MTNPKKGRTPAAKRRELARKGPRRSKTLATRRLGRDELAEVEETLSQFDALRPANRDHCKTGPRPCPYVSCKFHLYLDVHPETGSIKLNFPDLEVWEMEETCALDVADKGGTTLEEVGDILNLTRERIRQVEVLGLQKLRNVYQELGEEIPEELQDE
ncbi:MAG: DNA-binding protein [Myxococcales bacterium]|nr:DNA-binding protein [Myxococcales bacterium]